MIKNFLHKGLEEFFYEGTRRGIPAKHAQKIADILDRLDAAVSAQDMNYPGSHLHPLSGKWKGFWAIKVSANWRIIFRIVGNHAIDVNYLDYH